MSDNESLTDCSNLSVSNSYSGSSSEDSGSENFVFEDNFLPYQGEPLASSDSDSSDEDEQDLEGLTRAVLEQRYEKTVPFQSWCTCGNCDDALLVGSQEFRCCKEIIEVLGKFTFEGMDAGCILTHGDFNPLTNITVLLQVGPLLKSKSGKRYNKHGHTQNEFLRAVAYRWLARWLFGEMGWENTRPLPACIYHNIRSRFTTGESKGYVSGQERATETE